MNRLSSAFVVGVNASISNEAFTERQRVARANSTPWKRPVWLGVNLVSNRYPKAVSRALGLTFVPKAVEFVGIGAQSIVIKDGDSVVRKILSKSLLMTDAERKFEAAKAREQHQALAEALGEFVLPHEVVIEKHPLFPDHDAIQLLQKHAVVAIPEVFGQDATSAASNLAVIRTRAPSVVHQLTPFINQSRRLYSETGLIPDLNGSSNVVVDNNDSLLVIDSQPLCDENPIGRQLALEQLDLTERELQTI